MTTYFEYKVNLTANQKRILASTINSRTPLKLRIKHSNLSGNDELMLTKTQLKRIQKSLNDGTGVDIKISKTQIRKSSKTRWKSFHISFKSWSKSFTLCCKRNLKSCTSFGNWRCFCFGFFGN